MDTTLAPAPFWRSLLRPLITSRGYTALTRVDLLGLPLGVAYFTWLVTGLSVGLGLAITLAGIPILTAVFATVRPLLALERGPVQLSCWAPRSPGGLASRPHRRGVDRPPEGLLDRRRHVARHRLPARAVPDRHGHVQRRRHGLQRRAVRDRRADRRAVRHDRAGIWSPDSVAEDLRSCRSGSCCSSRPAGSPRAWRRARGRLRAGARAET